jgi:hypothetical protein
MQLEQPQKIRMWHYMISHSTLTFKYPGVIAPVPDMSIAITFYASGLINAPLEFMSDALEFEDNSTPVAEFDFSNNQNLVFKFLFKCKGEVVGRVEAAAVTIEFIPRVLLHLPKYRSKLLSHAKKSHSA